MRSIRWRRHRRLVVGFVLGVGALMLLFGESRVTAITTGEGEDAPTPASVDLGGAVALFDDARIHDVELEYDARDYRRMIAAYRRDETKEAIEATITIDGTRIEQVGIRLKGNSTLRALGGRGFRGGRAGGGFGGGPPRGGVGFFGGLRGAGAPASADDPEHLPLLVEFDEFVEGQRYEGYEAIAIRPGGMVTGETALNEALALRLTDAAGEPTPRSMYASFSVNGGDPVLRLVLEEPDTPFVEDHFEHDGVLYKSLAGGSFTDLGGDPLLYRDSFRQITRKGQQDLQLVIDLIRWTNEATDAEFAARLDERVDVDALARYVALHNLLLDFDDMAGPGQNYYLWYDLDEERFTVVSWDLNFAFSGNPLDGPFDGGRGRFGPRGGHVLKERFLRTPAFRRLYLEVRRELAAELFGSGRALAELRRLERLVAGSGLVRRAALDGEVEGLRDVLEQRVGALR